MSLKHIRALCWIVVAAGVATCRPTGAEFLPIPPLPIAGSIQTSMYVARTNVPFEGLQAECEHYIRTRGDSQVVVLPNVGLATNIPEFHDCQRMINKTGDQYSSLIGVYATPYRFPGWTGDGSNAHLLAVILNYDSLYDPLNIRHGVNCLYVRLAGSPGAWIVPGGLSPENPLFCDFARPVAALGPTTLEVKRSTDFSDKEYPRVARWDWNGDTSRNEQYIGVECEGWCEIGRAGFVSSKVPRFPLPPNMIDDASNPVYRIKGWYDVQRLAIRDAATGRLMPGPDTGYIFPARALDTKGSLTDFNEGVPVAVAFVSGRSQVYYQKYMLTDTMGTRIALGALGANPGVARLSGPATAQRRRVTRTPHPVGAPKVRGNVRWHWREQDEAAWVACVNGCCQVEPF